MADTRRIVKVFLASPSDLGEERRIAKEAIDDINIMFANADGYHVELVGWEDIASSFGRPQEIINRNLDRCEVFIGMLWRHWGSPPDNEQKYTSGFEEEFEISLATRATSSRPEISLFFKKISDDHLTDPGESLKQVLAFKKRITEQKIVLYEHFDDAQEFSRKFSRCISKYIQNLKREEITEQRDETQTRPIEDQKLLSASEKSDKSELPQEGVQFLQEFIDRTHVEIDNLDVARLRLLSSISQKQGNDDFKIGPHDANIIFQNRKSLELGHKEIFGLIESGLEHSDDENIPLWHWLCLNNGIEDKKLQSHSLSGSDEKRAKSIRIMTLIGEDLVTKGSLRRQSYLESWLSDEADPKIKIAALIYLKNFGLEEDIPAIRREFEKGENQTSDSAAEAIIEIMLKISRKRALTALYELQPKTLDKDLIDRLFNEPASLESGALITGLSHECADVRLAVSKILFDRDQISSEIADKLSLDANVNIRLVGLYASTKLGISISEAAAKEILVKPKSKSAFGDGMTHEEGKCLEEFKKKLLLHLPVKELEQKVLEESVFEIDAKLALYRKQYKKRTGDLESNLKDTYKTYFASSLAKMSTTYASESSLIERVKALENFLRGKFTRSSLEVIYEKNDASKIDLVRDTLKSSLIFIAPSDVEFIGKHGRWDDISLIIELLDRTWVSQGGILSIPEGPTKWEAAAKAIYGLGRNRINDLFATPLPSSLLEELLYVIPPAVFRSISEETIFGFFSSTQDRVRKIAALKSILSHSKTQVSKLFDSYVYSGDWRYYNVIYWLDLGVSLPKEMGRAAANRALLRA